MLSAAALLLKRIVTEEEYACYEQTGVLLVTTPHGTYRIAPSSIDLMQEGKKVAFLCIVLTDAYYPSTDSVIMKYLLVKSDLDRLWRTAGISVNYVDSALHPLHPELLRLIRLNRAHH